MDDQAPDVEQRRRGGEREHAGQPPAIPVAQEGVRLALDVARRDAQRGEVGVDDQVALDGVGGLLEPVDLLGDQRRMVIDRRYRCVAFRKLSEKV